MKYTLKTTSKFEQDLVNLHRNMPKLFTKAAKLLEEIENHPRTGTGHPERLKHYEVETWSRQINKQHRMVYEIHDATITVILLSVYGHYGDK